MSVTKKPGRYVYVCVMVYRSDDYSSVRVCLAVPVHTSESVCTEAIGDVVQYVDTARGQTVPTCLYMVRDCGSLGFMTKSLGAGKDRNT